jgi:bacteriorhodopsin
VEMPTLTFGQYQLVYNVLSLAIAAMFGSFVFFIVGRGQLAPKYRPAMILSALVVGIAGYHYWRIFDSWGAAYALTEAGNYVASGAPFNDAYRYVDWLLTVPLLVAELVAVLVLAPAVRNKLLAKLIFATIFMIGLGYPGEIATDTSARALWGALSTVPFVYILYVLWTELNRAAKDNAPHVKVLLRNTRLLLLGTWGFYPIAYLMPQLGIGGASAEVALQVGYSIADITAKCGYGLMIYFIAKAKMEADAANAVAQATDAAPARAQQVA